MEWSFPPKATWSFLGTPTLQDWVTPISRVIPPAPGLLVTQTNVMPIKCNWKIETLQNCTLKTVNSNKLYLNKGYVQYSGFEHLSVVYFDQPLGASRTKKCPKYFFEPFSTKTAKRVFQRTLMLVKIHKTCLVFRSSFSKPKFCWHY